LLSPLQCLGLFLFCAGNETHKEPMEDQRRRDIRSSFYDGMFAHVFAILTGGVFLTGFALHLGMNDFMIGLLASLPFLVTVFQLPASIHISRRGARKTTAFHAALAARAAWIFVLVAAVVPFGSPSMKLFFILGIIFLSYAAASVSYVAWLSWMSDLIPEEIRGRFFGTRNMLCGASGTVAMLIFGKLLDRLNGESFGSLPLGFGLTFLVAAGFGILGLRFLNGISEPVQTTTCEGGVSLRMLSRHLVEDRNFRKFLVYSLTWNFSVYFAGPFFTVYFLRDLGYSYSFVAALGVISGFSDILGMQAWGRISDKVKNKAVIQFASWVAIFLPLAWVTVRPQCIVFPVILHVLGGGFWAGINLCTNNLLLRITPRQNRPIFLSLFHMVTGLGAAGGPVLGGLVLTGIAQMELHLLSWNLLSIQVLFFISTLFRLLSFQILKTVHEPEEATVGKVIRIFRSLRGLNLASGFNMVLHPFVEVEKSGKEGRGSTRD